MASDPSIPDDLSPAYRECLRLAAGHYENFPVASLLLSRSLRPHVAALYAFARTADDLADEKIPGRTPASRLKDLHSWERGFRRALAGRETLPVLRAFAHTVRCFSIPPRLPLALLKAFRMDVTIHRYPTWERLLHYCRHSADPVGRMVLLIHGVCDERLHRLSDHICSGLQLINFWQDTSVDLARGRIYYPSTEWRKAGVKEKDLLGRRDSPALRTLVKDAVDFTEAYYDRGRPLLDGVSGRLKSELRATFWGGRGILKKIRALDYNVADRRPVLSFRERSLLAVRALWPGR